MNKIEIGVVKLRSALHRVFPSNKSHLFTSVIVTAAGSGIRMGGVSKQLMPLLDVPCILYSLKAFQECNEVDEIVVTAKAEEVEKITSLCASYGITKLFRVVSGGSTRQESVSNGFGVISKESELVAIHDAARPLITPEQICQLLQSAKRWGSACAAKKVTDTVKRAKKLDMIDQTIPRENLFTVQTPQVFKTDIYRVALAMAQRDGIQVTDDCALVENAGFPIKLCEIGDINVKLTTPEDIKIVCTVLKERKNG